MNVDRICSLRYLAYEFGRITSDPARISLDTCGMCEARTAHSQPCACRGFPLQATPYMHVPYGWGVRLTYESGRVRNVPDVRVGIARSALPLCKSGSLTSLLQCVKSGQANLGA
jgi:hypothetical protein